MGLRVLPYIPAALHHLLHSWGWKLQKAADGEDKEHTFWDSLFPASILCSNQRNEIAKPLPHFWKVWKAACSAVSNWRGTFQLHGRRGNFVADFCLFVYLFCKAFTSSQDEHGIVVSWVLKCESLLGLVSQNFLTGICLPCTFESFSNYIFLKFRWCGLFFASLTLPFFFFFGIPSEFGKEKNNLWDFSRLSHKSSALICFI